MGAIWFSRASLIGQTTELVGYKSGITLTRERAGDLLGKEYEDLWKGEDEETLRVRAEVYDALFTKLLYELGCIASPSPMPSSIAMYHRYKDDPEASEIWMGVMKQFIASMSSALTKAEKTNAKALDPAPFLRKVKKQHGTIGLRIGIELIEGTNQDLFRSPWGGIRQVEWADRADLEDLFRSESLETQYGQFMDQRFIDYLARNFSEVDAINWRKFEGLTAEFFVREGWHVEIGPGRADGGIDIRVWPDVSIRDAPPAILIQCKRQRRKIDKTIVKALYADVDHEAAQSGLIVTTSQFSPGARAVVATRGYNVREADRECLRTWIHAMRSPGAGAFLAQ